MGPRGERLFDLALVAVLVLPVLPYVLFASAPEGLIMLSQLLPLLWRRSHPVPVFATVALFSAGQAAVIDTPLWSQVAFPVATYSVARYAGTAWSVAAAAVGMAGAVVASVDWLRGYGAQELTPGNVLSYVVPIALIVAVSWTLGTLGRVRQAYVDALVERGERLQRDAAQQAALAAMEERQRIAREMHDVVAHGLTTIVVQAEGARAAAAHDPAVADPALATIARAGREAITEMRGMLGLLRGDTSVSAPQPRLADLTTLLAETRAAGTPVRGQLQQPLPDVPDGVALTAYRVVQEALSNVRKHAGPDATADVAVRARPGVLEVEVRDDGRGAAAPDDGRGLGLTGMAERVATHDGTLETGPCTGGGFRVWARIPV